MSEPVYLIERGQPEKQEPTVWWTGDDSDPWSSDPNKARQFPTREAATATNEAKSPIPGYRERFGRVTEHQWIDDAPPMTPVPQPRTTAGRTLLEWLRFARKRTGAAGIPDADAILAIEAEAAALDVEALARALHTAECECDYWPGEHKPKWRESARIIAAAYRGER